MGRLGALFGPSWGPLGPSFGPSWRPLGRSWGDLGGLLDRLGPSEGRQGAKAKNCRQPKENQCFWPLRAFPEDLLEASWAVLEASWGRLGAFGAILRPAWAVLVASWANLEAILDHLGRTWRPSWPSWRLSWAILEPSGAGTTFGATSGQAFRVAGGTSRSPRVFL